MNTSEILVDYLAKAVYSPGMKTNTIKFTYETNYRFPALVELRKHILQYRASTREIVAQIVSGHGFQVHCGGHHVAVIQDNVRLAIITSKTHPDFN